jgi:hypothetical protein
MSRIEVTKNGVINTISSSLEFAQTAFPAKDGYSHTDVTLLDGNGVEIPQLTPEEVRAAEEKGWRDDELKNSDWIVPTSDHPQHTAYITYRAALRAWPSTSDFPDTKPVLGS